MIATAESRRKWPNFSTTLQFFANSLINIHPEKDLFPQAQENVKENDSHWIIYWKKMKAMLQYELHVLYLQIYPQGLLTGICNWWAINSPIMIVL